VFEVVALVFVVVFVVGGGDEVVEFVKDGFPGSYLACKKTPHNYHPLNHVYQEVK
jgi:hypothetical protein